MAYGITVEAPPAVQQMANGSNQKASIYTATDRLSKLSEYDITDGAQYEEVFNAVGSAVEDWFNRKIKKITDSFTKMEEVDLIALTETIGLACKNFDEISGTVGNSLIKLACKMLGVSTEDVDTEGGALGVIWDFLESLGGDFLENLKNDPQLQDAIGSLDAVKASMDIIQSLQEIFDTFKKIWEVIEPIIPMIEIAADLSAAYGTGIPKAMNELSVEQQKQAMQLMNFAGGLLRDLLPVIKIKVPSIIVDSASIILEPTASEGLGGAFSQGFFAGGNGVIGGIGGVISSLIPKGASSDTVFPKVPGSIEDPLEEYTPVTPEEKDPYANMSYYERLGLNYKNLNEFYQNKSITTTMRDIKKLAHDGIIYIPDDNYHPVHVPEETPYNPEENPSSYIPEDDFLYGHLNEEDFRKASEKIFSNINREIEI